MDPTSLRRLCACSLLALAVGCGGKSSSDAAAGDASTTGDASSDAAGAWSPVCPGTAPAQGSACSKDGLSCEYGDGFDPGCNTVVTCAGGTWGGAVLPGGGGGGLCDAGANPPGCPAQQSGIVPNAACTAAGATCIYATGICVCSAPADPTPGAVTSWSCGPQPGCPMPRPRIGSACSTPDQACDYLPCGVSQVCTGGVWQPSLAGCGG